MGLAIADKSGLMVGPRSFIGNPYYGHTLADHRMDRCWLQGQTGDALHALSHVLGCNIRWLMKALQAKARRVLPWLLQMASVGAKPAAISLVEWSERLLSPVMHWLGGLVPGRQRPVSRLASA